MLEASHPHETAGLDTSRTLEQHSPPFDLTSDMLFACAWCPTDWLQNQFGRVPFLSIFNRTPLLMWFSRIKTGCSYDPAGKRQCMSGGENGLYNELTVIALLRQRAVFVPALYAASEHSVGIARGYYNMPKQLATMEIEQRQNQLDSVVKQGRSESFVRARLWGTGKLLGSFAARFLPRQAWPALFPSGGAVRVLLQAMPRVQFAGIPRGQLALDEAWLRKPLPLFPLGVFVPDLAMQLPKPGE